jgi:hypothetical protein
MVLKERIGKMDKGVFAIKGALLYFENGTRRRADFQAKTTDLERIREIIKNKHNAKVVRLEYEETI